MRVSALRFGSCSDRHLLKEVMEQTLLQKLMVLVVLDTARKPWGVLERLKDTMEFLRN